MTLADVCRATLMGNVKNRRSRGSSGVEYVIAMVFVAITAIVGYRAFGKQVRCRMGIATTALDLDGKEVNACDDGTTVAQNGPSGNGSGDGNGPAGPTATINCNACKVKNPDGTPGCFVAGTPIMTEDGLRPIETITTGTVVLTRDQFGGEQEWRPVLRTVVHQVHALVRLTIVDGAGVTDTLVATPDHPLQSLERGWVVAAELVPGRDHLLDAAGEQLDLVDGESLAADVPVYNFAVEGTHTYFVGLLAVWAHNSDPCTGTSTPRLGNDHSVPSVGGSGNGEGSSTGGGGDAPGTPPGRSGPDETSLAYWEGQKTNLGDNTITAGSDYWKNNPPSSGSDRTNEDVVNEGPNLRSKLNAAAASDSSQISIYRGMQQSEADAIVSWSSSSERANVDSIVGSGGYKDGDTSNPKLSGKQLAGALKGKKGDPPGIIPIGAHLGDEGQASGYGGRPGETVVKITLKPGAHKVLFDPNYIAVQAKGNPTAVINQVVKGQNGGQGPARASDGEGAKPGWIGLKSESDGQFSFSLGKGDPSRLLFQQFVGTVEIMDPPPGAASTSNTKPGKGGKQPKPPKKQPPARGNKPPRGTVIK